MVLSARVKVSLQQEAQVMGSVWHKGDTAP